MNKYAASAGHNRPVPPEASLVILFGILSSRNVFQLGVLPYSKQRIDTQAATGCDWILQTVCLKRIDTLAATCRLISGKRHRIFIHNTYTDTQTHRYTDTNNPETWTTLTTWTTWTQSGQSRQSPLASLHPPPPLASLHPLPPGVLPMLFTNRPRG